MSKKRKKHYSAKPTFSGYCAAKKNVLDESDIEIKHKLEFEQLRKEYDANLNMPEEKKKEFLDKCEIMANDYLIDKCFDFVEKKSKRQRKGTNLVPSPEIVIFKKYNTDKASRYSIITSNEDFYKLSNRYVSIYDKDSKTLYFIPSSEKGCKLQAYNEKGKRYKLNISSNELDDEELDSVADKYFLLCKRVHSKTNKTLFCINLSMPEDELVSVMRELKEYE